MAITQLCTIPCSPSAKTYPLTVKAKPEPLAEEDYVGYLFVHFTGTEEDGTKEQTYFSMSEDGLYWEDLNDNQPVLTSTFGESGLRDHFIARSAEGDRFYMIATDLSIANNNLKATERVKQTWMGNRKGCVCVCVCDM